ncbi:thioredoxin-like protein 1 [Anopheles bellator]|uniref:thioredoxin-like protein 1 n=1 Tax=Anopheles bellator TaxID=139047 RepID=UPI0026475937|nr:thioredoxin-like protein 1 [Anopheles bellator]
MSVRAINDEGHFQAELSAAGAKLVVVDFTATWCGPCRNIAPLYEQLPTKYPKAVFLKVDVDKCSETASSQGVSSMPTFIFYRARTKIDRLQGADINGLEAKIQKHYVSSVDESGEDYGQGMLDLTTFIQKNQCECLNEADEHPLSNALSSSGGHLASDCDEQLIISVTFNQIIKLHSLKMKAPPTHGPKNIRLFINQPRTIDFDMADSHVSIQDLEVDPKDLETGNPIKLKFVKFQNVQNIQMFVKDNQSGGETTIIDHLAFIGQPIQTTKMDDFQRVAGKKGESH